jgi:hypothetical protein
VSVISSCAKEDIACARAAARLSLSVHRVKRLKKSLCEQGEAALAHANLGRPSPRRRPSGCRQVIAAPGSPRSAQDNATGKILAAQFFPSENRTRLSLPAPPNAASPWRPGRLFRRSVGRTTLPDPQPARRFSSAMVTLFMLPLWG